MARVRFALTQQPLPGYELKFLAQAKLLLESSSEDDAEVQIRFCNHTSVISRQALQLAYQRQDYLVQDCATVHLKQQRQ